MDIKVVHEPKKRYECADVEDLLRCLLAGIVEFRKDNQHFYASTLLEAAELILQQDPEYPIYKEWITKLLHEIIGENETCTGTQVTEV